MGNYFVARWYVWEVVILQERPHILSGNDLVVLIYPLELAIQAYDWLE